MNEPGNDKDTYRLMIGSVLNIAIFSHDENGRILNWNAGAERLTGYRAAEMVGQHFSRLWTREDARSGKPERELAAAANTGRFVTEGWRTRKDGTRFWAHTAISALVNEAGECLGFVKFVQDITEQKLALDELRRSRERFHHVIESAPNALMMVNRLGRIEMLNLKAECTFGYSRDELLGQPVEMLIPERYRKQHPRFRLLFFAEPASRSMGAGRDLYALTKDGVEFPVQIALNPIDTDEGPMVLLAIVDMTDRILREEELLRSEARFRLVIESVPIAMVMVSREGKIEMANHQLELLFGYRREELLGKQIEMLIPERWRSSHQELRAAFFRELQRRSIRRELRGLRKDGIEIFLEISLNPIETEEGVMALATITDVSDRKAKNAQFQNAIRD
ncbi:MAG TPA: PAS domain S-box protein [Methylocella sp.]|nr:PAS domain S-box protein [Methylocella sp.]